MAARPRLGEPRARGAGDVEPRGLQCSRRRLWLACRPRQRLGRRSSHRLKRGGSCRSPRRGCRPPVDRWGEATIDAAAMAEFTSQITGPDGVLASSARLVLDQLGLNDQPTAVEPNADDAAILPAGRDRARQRLGEATLPHSTRTRPFFSMTGGPAHAKTSRASSTARTARSASSAPAGAGGSGPLACIARRPRSEARFDQIAADAVTEPSAQWSARLRS